MQALPVGRARDPPRAAQRTCTARLRHDGGCRDASLADALDATLVNMRFVKPIDEALIAEIAASHRAIVTLEENAIAGGAGSAVLEVLQRMGSTLPVLQVGVPDGFVEHGIAR